MAKSRKKKNRGFSRVAGLFVFFMMAAVGAAAFVLLTRAGNNEIIVLESKRDVQEQDMITTEPSGDSIGKTSTEELLSRMTIEEKAAQMFMVTPEALTGYSQVIAAGEATKTAFDKYPVGGLIYFNDNLQSAEQVKTMLSNLQSYSRDRIGTIVFTGIDEEGGTQVARIGNKEAFGVPQVSDMSEIGASGDKTKAYDAGRTIGGYLSELGFNLDFAPVADVLSNELNTVVKKRSFGPDADLTAEFSRQFYNGLKAEGIQGVYKHFPGHGATTGDTHDGYAFVDKSLAELKENELVPFQAGIDDGVKVIMAGHISVPEVTGDDEPASLSEKLINGVLRNDMGFNGVVITDSLSMDAVTNKYTAAEACINAIEAGADILLMPSDFESAYEAVIKAVSDGRISEERINQSAARILKIKAEMESN